MRTFASDTLYQTAATNIKSTIRNNPIVTSAVPQIICEWNMNNVFFANGFNDFGGGNDLYSTMYSWKERKDARQPAMQANSFAKQWRETNGIRCLMAVDKTTAASHSYNLNAYHTYATHSTDPGAFRNWVSPYNSTATGTMANVWPSEGLQAKVDIPPIIPGKRNVIIHGVMAAGAGADIFLLTSRELNTTLFKKGNYILMEHGFGLSQLANVDVRNSLQIENSGRKDVLEPVVFSAGAGTKILTFGSNAWGLFRKGQVMTVTVNGKTFTSHVAGFRKRKNPKKPNQFWVEIILDKALTFDIAAKANITVKFNFIRVTQVGGATVSAITRNQGLTANVGACVLGVNYVSAPSINKLLATTSYLGGGGIKFTNNIDLDYPLVIPPNVFLDFNNITVKNVNNSFPYMAYFGSARTVLTGMSYNRQTAYNTLTLSGTPATNIKQSLIPGARIILSINDVTTGTLRRVITKYFGFTITAYNGTTTLTVEPDNKYTPQFSGAGGVISLAPNEAVASGHNIINGGTWNANNASDNTLIRGVFSMSNAHYVLIRNQTWQNTSNAHGINIEGCTNIRIASVSHSTTLNHSTNHNEAAGVFMTSHTTSTKADNCDNVQIVNSSFSSVYGIRGNVNVYSVSEKNTKVLIGSTNATGSQKGIDLCDFEHTTIYGGTITGTAGPAIHMAARLGTVTNNYITGVTTSSGTNAIYLEGTGSDAAVVRTVIDNNTLTATSTYKVKLSNTAYIAISNNAAVATSANIDGYGNATTGCARLYYAVGALSATYMIKNVEPTTQYIKDRAEVLTVQQSGERITLTLEKGLEDVRVGDYLMLQNVNLGVDGPKKIVRLESTNVKTPWVFDKVTLQSNISQRIQNAKGGPVELDPDNDFGFASVVREVPINKITAKFEISHGSPKSAVVQTKSRGVWTTVYTSTDLSGVINNEDELGDSKVDNIKTLNIYLNNGTWGTTKTYYDPSVNNNIVSVDAVRVIVDTTVANQDYITVTELSGRLALDMTNYATDFSFDKELGESSNYAPIGRSSSNSGSVNLLNDTRLFDPNNIDSPIHDLLTKDATVHAFVTYGGSDTMKLATMITDTWSSDGRDSASVKLVDKSRILQNRPCRDIFIYDKKGSTSAKTAMSVKAALSVILDSVSFGNYVIYGMDDFERMKFLWTKKENNPWTVLQDIAEVFQIALYFDEIGRLHIMSKNFLYADRIVRTADASSGQNKITIKSTSYGKPDLSQIKGGMLVTCNTAGVIPDNTVVMTVGSGSNGDQITLSNNTTNNSTGGTFIFGRDINYDILGGTVGNRLVPPVKLEAANNYYNFNVQERVSLPGTLLDEFDTESYPTCTKLIREPDFYVYSYSNSGTVASLTLIPTTNAIPAPVNGSAITVSNLGSSFDDPVTLTSVTAGTTDGVTSYRVTYNKTATAVLESTEEVGSAHYTSTGVAGWKAKSLQPSTQYTISGYYYLDGGYGTLSISNVGNVSTTGTWTAFSGTFTTGASETERLITFTPAAGSLGLYAYLYNMQVTYTPTTAGNIVEGGYDEVLEASQEKLDSASKVRVKYKNINIFGENSTAIEGAAQDVGRNATLYEIPDTALSTFEIKEIKNGAFKYDISGMNENADPEFDNIVVGASSPIDVHGQFIYKDKYYEYIGLQALAPYAAGTGKAISIVKNEDDRDRMRELNNGLPPRWTGLGILKKNYPEVYPQEDESGTPPAKTIVAQPPSNAGAKPGLQAPMEKGGRGMPLESNHEQFVAWESGLKNLDSIGAILDVDKFLNKCKYRCFGVMGFYHFEGGGDFPSTYILGVKEIMSDEKSVLVPYGVLMHEHFVDVKGGKVNLKRSSVPLEIVDIHNNLPSGFIRETGLKIEVNTYIKNKKRYFVVYLNTIKYVTFEAKDAPMFTNSVTGVYFGEGIMGYVQTVYGIKYPSKLPQEKRTMPDSRVGLRVNIMHKQLEDQLLKGPLYRRMTAKQRQAVFDKYWNGDGPLSAKAARAGGQWGLADYFTTLRKEGALITKKDFR